MRMELVDRRVIGAVRFRDAVTNLPLAGPFVVSSDDALLTQGRTGMTVIRDVPGDPVLAQHKFSFDQPPATPVAESVSVELRVSDPDGRYLPRRAHIQLPRSGAGGPAAPLFAPVDVPLYPSAAVVADPGWAVVRATVLETASGARLPWALVRISAADGSPQPSGVGLADWRGEAFLAVAGLPVTTWSDGPGNVLAREFEVKLEVAFDKDKLKKIPDLAALTLSSARAGRDPDPNPGYVPDPQKLGDAGVFVEASLRSNGVVANRGKIASGREVIVDLLVTLP